MVVDGAVVMVENIVRHLSHSERRFQNTSEKISDASHEVQRPVFYAIAIIITAYLPIFTLQRVEGRLFHPMAWTVAFALLGALLFSIVIAPVLASFAFAKGAHEWRNPVMQFLTERYRIAVRWAIRQRAHHSRGVRGSRRVGKLTSRSAASSVPNFCRIWMKARSGCAARLRPAPGPTKGSALPIRPASCFALSLKSPNAPAKWDGRMTAPIRPVFSIPNTSLTSSPRNSGGRYFTRTKTN